jgi:probable rRNA maturation factor
MPRFASNNRPAHKRENKLIQFFFQGVKASLADRTHLKRYIQSIFKKEGRDLESINFIFCSDKALLDINRQFLGHDFYTDIITFDLSESKLIRAEIYISIERVRDNASQLGISFKSEIHRVIFHGVLHLCGFKDKNKADKAIMRGKEDFYLSRYFK